jgi:hypothetical protein
MESLTRRKPSRRIFKDLGGLKGIPPVPYPGWIYRHVSPVVIEDTEELSDTAWSTGNFYEQYERNFSLGLDTFAGIQWALYYKHLEVTAGSGVAEWIMEPIRFSISEADLNGDDFEHWLIKDPEVPLQGVSPTYEDQISAPSSIGQRGIFQALCSNEFLPVSGNSHVSHNTVTSVDLKIQRNSCLGHLTNTILGRPWPLTVTPNAPRRVHVFGKYARYRVNGTPTGPLHDFGSWNQEATPGLWGFNRVFHPMPSAGFPNYAAYGIENWNLEFTAGDNIEIDVWFKVMALREAATRHIILPVARYCTANNATVSRPSNQTPTAGYSLQRRDPGQKTYIAIGGLNMSEGFNPAAHTYLFEAQDGAVEFGKAQVTGSTAFQIDSKHLNWAFVASGGASACGGTATWISAVDVFGNWEWNLVTDDCDGGGVPVEPPYTPTTVVTETTACDCSAAPPAGDVSVNVSLWWDNEMVWLKVIYVFEDEGPITVYYRPESSGDYVDEVNDRWEGEIHSGPTGCFDHLGATTFRRWNGTQSPPYDDAAYVGNTGSRVVSDYDADIPREILVTKVAK